MNPLVREVGELGVNRLLSERIVVISDPIIRQEIL
jgi:hypothetical protein